MNQDKLSDIIEKGENENIEFKSTFNIEVIESLVAFANSRGGTVYIGISDSGKISGVNISQESVQQWVNEIKGKTKPQLIPDSEIYEIDNKIIVQLFQPEYPIKPVGLQGRYYKRVKNSNHLLSAGEVSNLHLASINSSWDSHIDPLHSLEDISIEKVQKAMQVLRKKGFTIEESYIEFLSKCNLLRNQNLTFGAYLLFKKEDSYLSTIELGRFQDDITIKDSERSKSDLLTQVDTVLHFVKKHINKAIIITGNAQNDEKWEYPLDAVREIVMNMIVHRDYRATSDSIVKIYNNKIEFYNPGRLPDGITVEDLLNNTYRSTPRNKLIADFFKELGHIEKYGSGIRRIINLFKNADLPMPLFQNISEGFMVTVFSKYQHKSKNDTINDTKDDTVNDTKDDTKDRMMKVLELLKIDKNISIDTIALQLKVSRSTILRDLDRLKTNKQIIRIGSKKNGYWLKSDTLNDTINDTLNDTINDTKNSMIKILELLKIDKNISIDTIALQLKVSRSTVLRDLNRLKTNKQIIRIGSKKNGYWKIVES